MTALPPSLPPRFEPIAPLGKGGGGEVWSVRDRTTGDVLALKALSEEASEEEVVALVREAVALSGLEGLGVPRVKSFGRLPGSGRAYLVREIVEGESLRDGLSSPESAKKLLVAVAEAAEAVTVLHRAGLLHGDLKPANVIVGARGATLVDLGLAATYREGGASPLGLTPKYAAPELLEGGPLTVRAEVFALGATLDEVVDCARPKLDAAAAKALDEVVDQATRHNPDERFPSADELASALRRVLVSAGLASPSEVTAFARARAWPIVGLEGPAHELTALVDGLAAGGGVVVTGPRLSGRTTLVRRVAWTLGVRGRRVVHVEARLVADPRVALELELADDAKGSVVIVDDAERLDAAALGVLADLREKGARVVVVATPSVDDGAPAFALAGPTLHVFAVRQLDDRLARDLVERAIPSLGPAVVKHVVDLAEKWPGRLRAVVDVIASAPIVAPEDVDRLVSPAILSGVGLPRPATDLRALREALDRGHVDEAADMLAAFENERSLALSIARARLYTNRSEPRRALAALAEFEEEASTRVGIEPGEWALHAARAHLRAGDYPTAERLALAVPERLGPSATSRDGRAAVAEATSVAGLVQSFSSRHDEAKATLERGVELSRALDEPRLLSVALGSLAFALQRSDQLAEAEKAYEEALAAAEQAGDAGSVATTRLNLATISKTRGDLAATLWHLEAAVDMGRRSGRISTLRHALLNLANLDLYMGRLAKAQASLDLLAAERDELPRQLGAQLLALEAEAAGKSGDAARGYALCQKCADAYVALGRTVDAAEARLEGMLLALEGASPDVAGLRRELDDVESSLDGTNAHRALSQVVSGRLSQKSGDLDEARAAYHRAIESAKIAGLRDWEWKALELRAEVALESGQTLSARKDREAALGVLEEIAAKLPRDLREVFWNDPLRRSLRSASSLPATLHDRPAPKAATAPPTQDKLARVLEITREIAGTYDLKRLLERVTDHAIALSSAERGFVILKSRRPEANAELSIHASRGESGDDPHARFSQSIADRVIASGEPVVTTSARDDARMADYVSVHQLMLQSVACVPIRSRSSGVIGALYLETRLRPAARFSEELPVLAALADQVAIAIETARLVSENEARSEELARTNQELAKAREKLEEALDHRTQQLSATRRDLRSARAVLKSHFGYEGLVGTSEVMRRVYALVDRIKDTDVPVLITGESGTGKEIIARAIHNAGPRAKKTFVGINCGAIPEHLLESELFGHMRGAFTGADRDRKGLFREATEGTILLDEIGEMPHKMQAGLLRVLQEKVVRPVGGSREEPVDTRVVAATHRDLAAMVEAGTFREDLYYRLNVILVRVPPLRERLDDIPVLIDHFLGIFAARYSRERRSVSRAALKMLMGHRWPGNVRQLENVLLNAWVLSDAPELEPEDFETFDTSQRAKPSIPGAAPASSPSASQSSTSLDQHRNDEKDRILGALSSSNWNRVKAAELIGMPRRTFYRRLKEYGIQ